MVSFLHYFRPYLLGRQFKLRTDHSSLLWLRRFKEPEGQLAHWLEQLEEYDFEIVHLLGVRPICQHNFGNNRMLKEPRIMLE